MIQLERLFGLWLFLVLLFCSGCGTQDRYQVMKPVAPLTVQEGQWGTLTPVPTLWNTSRSNPVTVFADAPCFAVSRGLVYRATPAGYETMPLLPGDFNIKDLMVGPGGDLWAANRTGLILHLQNGSWQVEQDLDGTTVGMLLDNQGRVLVYGRDGYLFRREVTGEWFQQDLPDTINISRGWCDFGQSPVLLTQDTRLVTEDSEGWHVGEPLLEEATNDPSHILGSESGQMVIGFENSTNYLFNDGDGWQRGYGVPGLVGMFLFNNQLFAVNLYNDELMRWDGENWTRFLPLGDSGDISGWGESQSYGANRLLFFESGQTLVFDGQEVAQLTPMLGRCAGLVKKEGKNHLLMSKGLHLMEVDGIWREMGRPLDDSNLVAPVSLMTDTKGVLTFLGEHRIVTWDGAEYEEYSQYEALENCFQQWDGRLLLVTSSRMGLWNSGEITWLGEHDEGVSDIRGVGLESEERVWIQTVRHLRLVGPESSEIILTFQGWYPRGSVWDPEWGLVCFGPDRLIVVNGNDVQLMTPRWPSTNESDLCRIYSLIPDGLGGWLARDALRSSLLRFDGQQWSSLNHPLASSNYYGGHFTNRGDGTIIYQNYEEIYVLELK
jgi:hypothetical protein